MMFGTLCGLLSAAVYTGANACLRSVAGFDPIWVSAVKALPTALFMLLWMAIDFRRGEKILPPAPVLAGIALAGVCGQLGGNISFQWALGQIGMALTVPLTLGGMIVAASILGRVFLGEPIAPRMALALGILLVAIATLSLGAEEAHETAARQANGATLWSVAAGVGAACFSGLAYSVLNVVIRYSVSRHASLPMTLLTVSIVGLVGLGGLSITRLGLEGIAATPRPAFLVMLLAGLCNAVAFAALTKSLQLTSVVYVNALNATQATMAAVAGIVFFQEAVSTALVVGVSLTIVGLMLMRRGRQTATLGMPSVPATDESLSSSTDAQNAARTAQVDNPSLH
jgi:drug/metabolite transporter (DMT)-like permease